MKPYRLEFSNFFNFKGRSTRSAYWYFVLFLVILEAVAGILDVALFGLQTVGRISSIAGLATLIPSISVFVRRLHDISRTGWWLLIALIPIIGWYLFDNRLGVPADPSTGQRVRTASGSLMTPRVAPLLGRRTRVGNASYRKSAERRPSWVSV